MVLKLVWMRFFFLYTHEQCRFPICASTSLTSKIIPICVETSSWHVCSAKSFPCLFFWYLINGSVISHGLCCCILLFPMLRFFLVAMAAKASGPWSIPECSYEARDPLSVQKNWEWKFMIHVNFVVFLMGTYRFERGNQALLSNMHGCGLGALLGRLFKPRTRCLPGKGSFSRCPSSFFFSASTDPIKIKKKVKVKKNKKKSKKKPNSHLEKCWTRRWWGSLSHSPAWHATRA